MTRSRTKSARTTKTEAGLNTATRVFRAKGEWLIDRDEASATYHHVSTALLSANGHTKSELPTDREIRVMIAQAALGKLSNPYELIGLARDDRVRRALIRGLGLVEIEASTPYAYAIGRLGGDGAVRALTRHLSRVEGPNGPTGGRMPRDSQRVLASSARALLQLDPDNLRAASAMERAFRECEDARWRRAFEIAELYRPTLRTAAMERLRSVLLEILTGSDDEAFIAAIPGTALIDGNATRSRAKRLLESVSARIRGDVLQRLLDCSLHISSLAIAHLADERSNELKLLIIANAEGCVDANVRSRILQSALTDPSPTVRQQALAIVGAETSAALRRRLLKRALSDPDPHLRDYATRLVGTSAQGAT